MDKKLIVLTGPSGAGKTTLAKNLLRTMDQISFFISVTTRAPRDDEIPGQDYYFIDSEIFQEKIRNKEFIEYEEVYRGKFYGTLYSELARIWRSGKYPLRVVDVLGAKTLQEKFGGNALTIFVQPPSLKILEERLANRISNNKKETEERLMRASMEMDFANEFDQIIISNDRDKALAKATKIIQKFLQPKRKSLFG